MSCVLPSSMCSYSLMLLVWVCHVQSVSLQIPYVISEVAQNIGKKIWTNEGAGSVEQLLFWSTLEPFPSLGIGHFIWFPQNYSGPFTQTFPALIMFIKNHNVAIPAWLEKACAQGCPWSSRELFYQERTSQRMNELREFLVATIDVQALFMIERFFKLLPDLVTHINPSLKNRVLEILNTLMNMPQGLYVLVDYLNFKGSGLDPKERYHNQGWGLLQVLEYMAQHKQRGTPESFCQAAEYVLRQRVTNAPAGAPDAQRLPGWLNRLKKY